MRPAGDKHNICLNTGHEDLQQLSKFRIARGETASGYLMTHLTWPFSLQKPPAVLYSLYLLAR